MLPKVLHLYWGRNKPLTYLRALTYLSFKALNPDWTVNLLVPSRVSVKANWRSGEHPVEYRGEDYLKLLPYTEFDFSTIGVPESLSEVHKSDLLRWYLLGRHGGVWSDMDILYVNPLDQRIMNKMTGIGLCKYRVGGPEFQAIGFLSSEGIWGQVFFTKLFEFGLSQIDLMRDELEYQIFGAQLLDKFLEQWSAHPVNYLDPKLVYYYKGDGHNNDMYNYFRNMRLLKSEDTIGYHWYAGNPDCAKREVSIHPHNIRKLAVKYSICREALKYV